MPLTDIGRGQPGPPEANVSDATDNPYRANSRDAELRRQRVRRAHVVEHGPSEHRPQWRGKIAGPNHARRASECNSTHSTMAGKDRR